MLRIRSRSTWMSSGFLCVTSLFLQLSKVHAQAFLPDLALELYLHKLGILLHLAFQDDTPTEYVVPYLVARLVLLALRRWWRRLLCWWSSRWNRRRRI